MSGKRNGGLARAASLSPDRRSEIAKKAALTRWGKELADDIEMALFTAQTIAEFPRVG